MRSCQRASTFSSANPFSFCIVTKYTINKKVLVVYWAGIWYIDSGIVNCLDLAPHLSDASQSLVRFCCSVRFCCIGAAKLRILHRVHWDCLKLVFACQALASDTVVAIRLAIRVNTAPSLSLYKERMVEGGVQQGNIFLETKLIQLLHLVTAHHFYLGLPKTVSAKVPAPYSGASSDLFDGGTGSSSKSHLGACREARSSRCRCRCRCRCRFLGPAREELAGMPRVIMHGTHCYGADVKAQFAGGRGEACRGRGMDTRSWKWQKHRDAN